MKRNSGSKRRGGTGRRITVKGSRATILEHDTALFSRALATAQTTGLATLPKLSDDEGGLGIRSFTEMLSSIRVIEPDVPAARQASRLLDEPLANDANNLADALGRLQRIDPDAFDLLSNDLSACLPGLQGIGAAAHARPDHGAVSCEL